MTSVMAGGTPDVRYHYAVDLVAGAVLGAACVSATGLARARVVTRFHAADRLC